MTAPKIAISSPPILHVTVEGPGPASKHFQFAKPFRIGRSEECEICVKDDHVSRSHAEITLANGLWWIRDLNSANGLYMGGQRFEGSQLVGTMAIRLGIQGPEIWFKVDPPPPREEPPLDNEAVVARFVEHRSEEHTSELQSL